MSETIRDPGKVDIYDTTLRDGLQTVGVSMDIASRVEVAKQLNDVGVDVIEAGFPGSGPATGEHELLAVQAVAVAVDSAKVAALCRLVPGDVENGWAAVEAAQDKAGARLHLFVSTSEIQMKEQGKTPDGVMGLTKSEVARAKLLCDDVEFSPMDATRSDFEFMMRVCQVAVEHGATVINVPDTTGHMTHRQYGHLIAAVGQRIHAHHPGVIIAAHTHGDRGLSAAANMEAIGAGARQVEVAVNGIGPRLGNAGLADIVGNIREGGEPLHADIYTDVDPRQLRETSQLVAKLSGKAAPDNLAFTSSTAFAHVEGIHQHDVATNPRSFESLDADVYGQEPGQIVLGPLSGKAGVGKRLEGIGIELENSQLNAVTAKVKELAVQQGRDLADTDIERIVAQETGEEIVDRFELDESNIDIRSVTGGGDATISIRDNFVAELEVPFGTVIATSHGGGIDAAVKEINEFTGFEGTFETWRPVAAKGSDAQARIIVEVSYDGRRMSAFADDTSVDIATAKAYLQAKNLVDRVKNRPPNIAAELAA
jgi:2-isopropylmalate synthase